MLLKIAHRGVPALELENTLSSFEKALECDIDMIECDVRSVQDGIVVIHDRKVNRTTNGRGRVRDMSLNQIRKLETKNQEKVPLLEEVLDLVDKRARINLELKDPQSVESVAEVIGKFVEGKNWDYDDFLVSSFNYYALKKFLSLRPEVKVGLNMRRTSFLKLRQADKIGAFSVHVRLKAASQRFIKRAQKRGLKVLVWTVNKEKDIARIKGADGFFTDYAHRLC